MAVFSNGSSAIVTSELSSSSSINYTLPVFLFSLYSTFHQNTNEQSSYCIIFCGSETTSTTISSSHWYYIVRFISLTANGER